MRPRIGTAGWSIPRGLADRFPAGGGLQRYAARLDAIEINSTFYRSPRPETYARWRASVPAGFRFALKAPRALSHDARLADCRGLLEAFVGEAVQLGEALGPLLFQLPPSLAFDAGVAGRFFADLRSLYSGPVVCEPRHAGWFEDGADGLLHACQVARAAADPARVPAAAAPGGWSGLAYWRLHGSPRTYYSAYGAARLRSLAGAIAQSASPERWCIFDNTAAGAALGDALDLQALCAAEADD